MRTKTFGSTHKMVLGDHWLGGRGWAGPPEREKSTPTIRDYKATLKEKFASTNMLLEVCRRLRDAVATQQPAWRFTPNRPLKMVRAKVKLPNGAELEEDTLEKPSASEQQLISEAEAALTRWWDKRKAWKAIKDAVLHVTYARENYKTFDSSATVRLYIPSSLTQPVDGDESRREVRPKTLEEALDLIHVEAPDPTSSGVVRVRGNVLESFVYVKDCEGSLLEVITVDSSGETVIDVTSDDGSSNASYPLGGRRTIVELRGESLVTPQLVDLQRKLNQALTALSINMDSATNLERVLTNAKLPGGSKGDGGEESAPKIPVGPDTVQNWVGLPIKSAEGAIIGYTTPTYTRLDPYDPSSVIKTAEYFEARINAEARQRHAQIMGDAVTSGISRQQATADHRSSANPMQTCVEDGVREILETALRWAAYLVAPNDSSQYERFESLRAVVDVRVEASMPTPEDDANTRANFDAGLLDEETAMQRIGVQDTDAVKARRERDRARAQALQPLEPGEDPSSDAERA
ncbi:MAG: hypothetical protein HC933_19920 [Pleurocapsa sp. SU_196_0]|nr:hypothetical protein [Pleurocapsa sp. SU_196_0]